MWGLIEPSGASTDTQTDGRHSAARLEKVTLFQDKKHVCGTDEHKFDLLSVCDVQEYVELRIVKKHNVIYHNFTKFL